MMSLKFVPLVVRQVWRRRARTLLTAGGVAIAMFLFVAVQAMQRGVREATDITAADTTLVVYRENRFCPATSRLPEHYTPRIARVPGVASVVPMKIVVNNCRAGLDVVIFRGVQTQQAEMVAEKWRFTSGSLAEWRRRGDSAIVGERLASRRGLSVGEGFDAAGVRVTIAGVIASDEPQEQNVAYVHLPFLQEAARGGVGIVTQFNVKVTDSSRLEEVARAIDDEFRSESEPTQTRPEKAFVAQAGRDLVSIAGFTRYLGWACLAAVLALVANAVVLSVRDRVTEFAVLQTLGFRAGLILRLVVTEGIFVSLLGGAVGAAGAIALVHWGNFSLSTEGLSINISADWSVGAAGLAVSAAVGLLGGLFPAWRASRQEIAGCFRAV